MLIPMPQHMYWQSNQMEIGWKYINSLLHLRNCIIWPRNRNQSSLSCVVESSDFNHLREVSASLFYGHVPMGLLLIFSSVPSYLSCMSVWFYRRKRYTEDCFNISIRLQFLLISMIWGHVCCASSESKTNPWNRLWNEFLFRRPTHPKMIRSIVVENGFSPNSVQPLEPKILLPDCIVAEGQKI